MPATWVACHELSGSNGAFAYLFVAPAGAKARCTITFGVVYFVCPFGKPGGYFRPLGAKYGCVASSPSSMMAILTPCPEFWRDPPQSLSAPICCGLPLT